MIIWITCRLLQMLTSTCLFEQLSKGEQPAVQTLASYYMKATAELAADMNAEEILLADLIQEANSEPDPGAGQCR